MIVFQQIVVSDLSTQHIQLVSDLGQVFYWPAVPMFDTLLRGGVQRTVVYGQAG